MPIYEYECQDCGAIEEVVQKISDKPLVTCRSCSGTLRKMISQSSFHLRGGGWYADGYGKGAAGASSSSDSAEKNTSTSKSND